MDIKQIQEDKKKLEIELKKAIVAFEIKTNCRVNTVRVFSSDLSCVTASVKADVFI